MGDGDAPFALFQDGVDDGVLDDFGNLRLPIAGSGFRGVLRSRFRGRVIRLRRIRALVALCPMLGLLGTVTGMIEVFDVMAIAGSGNARGMAAGVSKAAPAPFPAVTLPISSSFRRWPTAARWSA